MDALEMPLVLEIGVVGDLLGGMPVDLEHQIGLGPPHVVALAEPGSHRERIGAALDGLHADDVGGIGGMVQLLKFAIFGQGLGRIALEADAEGPGGDHQSSLEAVDRLAGSQLVPSPLGQAGDGRPFQVFEPRHQHAAHLADGDGRPGLEVVQEPFGIHAQGLSLDADGGLGGLEGADVFLRPHQEMVGIDLQANRSAPHLVTDGLPENASGRKQDSGEQSEAERTHGATPLRRG
jgi:hypothetical protein